MPMLLSMIALLFVAFSALQSPQTAVEAFTVGARLPFISSLSTSTTKLYASLPIGYQEFGDNAIREAAGQCGLVLDDSDSNDSSKNRLDIEWKAGSIIVTVHGDVSLSAASSSGDDEIEAGDDNEDEDEEDDIPFGDAEGDDTGDDDEEKDSEEEDPEEEFSLSLLARTINRMLDDDGIGLAIAEVHSIEVTTPGVSDELVPGTPQFEAFKGFEVIVQQLDPKSKSKAKNPLKTIEGRLVERNDEFTIINIKGRMKKMRNDTVISVRLPKAKKEKGAR